jgi:hypothetical protein
VGTTGLCVLALLSHPERSYDGIDLKTALGRAVLWIARTQQGSGRLGSDGPRHIFNHLIAALALVETYRWDPAPDLLNAACLALRYALARRHPRRDWVDPAATVWGKRLIRSAREAWLFDGLPAAWESVEGAFECCGSESNLLRRYLASDGTGIVETQNLGVGCDRGSWEPIDRCGWVGGRPACTALSVLTLASVKP